VGCFFHGVGKPGPQAGREPGFSAGFRGGGRVGPRERGLAGPNGGGAPHPHPGRGGGSKVPRGALGGNGGAGGFVCFQTKPWAGGAGNQRPVRGRPVFLGGAQKKVNRTNWGGLCRPPKGATKGGKPFGTNGKGGPPKRGDGKIGFVWGGGGGRGTSVRGPRGSPRGAGYGGNHPIPRGAQRPAYPHAAQRGGGRHGGGGGDGGWAPGVSETPGFAGGIFLRGGEPTHGGFRILGGAGERGEEKSEVLTDWGGGAWGTEGGAAEGGGSIGGTGGGR